MPSVQRSDMLDDSVNPRGIAAILAGLALGVLFWIALYLIVT